MAQWQSKLDLIDIWNAVEEGRMSIQELSKEVSSRIRKLNPTTDEEILFERDDIADCFDSLSKDCIATFNEFDGIMTQLYDWADTPLSPTPQNPAQHKKVCWVVTNF